MRAGERPTRGAVIKRPRIPRRRVVAGGAKRSRKIRCDVIRNRAAHRLCAVPLIQMAAVAIRVGAGQGVVVIDMAGRAGRGYMKSGERPTGRAVIKGRRAPTRGCVAGGAVRQRERRAGRRVHGGSRLLPGC